MILLEKATKIMEPVDYGLRYPFCLQPGFFEGPGSAGPGLVLPQLHGELNAVLSNDRSVVSAAFAFILNRKKDVNLKQKLELSAFYMKLFI